MRKSLRFLLPFLLAGMALAAAPGRPARRRSPSSRWMPGCAGAGLHLFP